MKIALEHIVTSIVDSPEKVEIQEIEEDNNVNFTIKLAKEDIGKVIGKEGKVIRAIRNVMKLMSIKIGKRVNITLSEDTE